jgi:glycosyltransferase involved in cell wall biosynthesis
VASISTACTARTHVPARRLVGCRATVAVQMTIPLVCCCLPDKMGGIYTLVQHVVALSDPRRCRYRVVLTDKRADHDARGLGGFAGAEVQRVEHDTPNENLYAALRRVRRAIGDEPGVLLANDWIELAAVTDRDTHKAVLSVVHGDYDYYYDLAARHQDVVDAFICHNARVDARLRELLPHRRSDIHHIAPGVPRLANVWKPRPGRLRVLYTGRMHRDKGIFLFPEIDRLLRERGHEVGWTMVGDGPDLAPLRDRWSSSHVEWSGSRPAADVLKMYGDHDVFLLPSAFEGLPVSLLEAGAAGVVPVTSDLPGGIPEVVETGVTGFRVSAHNIEDYANIIATLDRDRTLVAAMSAAVRLRVTHRFDVSTTVERYQELFERYHASPRRRPARLRVPYGSRLDQRWLPNSAVRLIRRMTGAASR